MVQNILLTSFTLQLVYRYGDVRHGSASHLISSDKCSNCDKEHGLSVFGDDNNPEDN